jgi:hypothetical protein
MTKSCNEQSRRDVTKLFVVQDGKLALIRGRKDHQTAGPKQPE